MTVALDKESPIRIKHLVPENTFGSKNDCVSFLKCASEDAAIVQYDRCKEALLNVNHWHLLTGGRSAHFNLTDKNGTNIDGLIMLESIIKILMPGPKNKVGGDFDWVQVTKLDEEISGHQSLFILQLQPIRCPRISDKTATHFYTENASNTFILVKQKQKVQLSVHGRNEIPNLKIRGFINKLRNYFVAHGGIFGGSRIQWKTLIEAIIESKTSV